MKVSSPTCKQPAPDSRRQQGAALILMMFFIGFAVAAFIMKTFDAESQKARQDEKTMLALGEAKEALIAWAVSHRTTPGQLPWPDRREITSPNYDGQSDCSNANFNLLNSASEPNFLGQIPRIASTTPCQVYPGVGHFQDSTGNNLWYAVSRNLVRNYSVPENPIINPGIINNPTYPWMVVRNSVGAIVSDRVAVVIIAPGVALAGQNRSGAAPLPVHFLDQVTIGATTYANHDYAVDNEDFIIGDTTTNTFNDRLVFITIDELMAALEKRVANEAQNTLLNYRTANGNFPYAASLASATNQYVCQAETPSGPHTAEVASAGFLPVNAKVPGSDFSCGISRSGLITTITCDSHFTNMQSIEFISTASSFDSAYGLCSLSNADRTCTCGGEGGCGTLGPFFLCNTIECRTNVPTATITISANSGYEFTSATGTCTLSCGDAEINCTTNFVSFAGTGSRQTCDEPALSMPAWFAENGWQDYFYYRSARNETGLLSSGGRTDIEAVLVGTGGTLLAPAIAASKGGDQVRPSCEVNDYLDSVENTNLDSVFDSFSQRRSLNYNDRVYIVAP